MGKDITLVVMAAGMGSRFGGLKQLEPIGKNGEVILDFSVYDAVKAGFNKVVFVIKHAIEDDFKRIVGSRIEKRLRLSTFSGDRCSSGGLYLSCRPSKAVGNRSCNSLLQKCCKRAVCGCKCR